MCELWDVTDASGVATGETFARGSGSFPAGRFHVVATICAVQPNGRVLLTQRAGFKEFPFTWEFPGGSALAGETSADAARRELREETGLRVAPCDLRAVGRVEEATALVDLYVVPAPVPADVVADDGEVAAFDWVPLSEVSRRLRSGMMAPPWTTRLGALWAPLAAEVGAQVVSNG